MRVFLSLISFLSITLLYSQHGPRAGIGLATQSVGGLFQNTSDLLIGPIFGWHFEIPVHPQMSIMPEVLYMTKGAVVRNPAQATRSRTTLRYLEIPLLLKVLTDQSDEGLYLLGGPGIGQFLSGRFQTWQEGQQIVDSPFQTGRNTRKFEFSGTVGMGFQSHRLAFDVRAQTSLTPFDRFIRIQNVVYSLNFAYRLRKAADRDQSED